MQPLLFLLMALIADVTFPLGMMQEFLSSNAEHFSCDTAINADGMQSGEDSPGIVLGMRSDALPMQ